MKVVGRDFPGGYYLSDDPIDPLKLMGIRYLHGDVCGQAEVDGKLKNIIYIRFTPDEMPDTKGDKQEAFDIAGIYGDSLLGHPLCILAITGGEFTEEALLPYAPSARSRVLACLEQGMDPYEAVMMHIARLVDSYIGETYQEAIEYRPELVVKTTTTDPATEIVTESVNFTKSGRE